MDLVITGGTLVTASGEVRADLAVEEGVIAQLGADLSQTPARRVIDATGKLVLPGLIDGQVRLWRGAGGRPSPEHFAETTAAAACGGVTTVLTRARVNQGEDPEAALETVRQMFDGRAAVDWGLHVALSEQPEATALLRALRAHGITSVLVPMARAEGAAELDDGALLGVFQAVAGAALAVAQCENGPVIRQLLRTLTLQPGARGHAQLHPAWAEAEAITRAATLAEAAGAHLLALGVSGQAGLEAVRRAKECSAHLHAETTPHHLTLSRDLLEGDEGHLWVVNPPLRPRGEAQALWRALEAGLLDAVSSHHRAVPRSAKRAGQTDGAKAVPGLPGVETLLPVLWSEGVEKWRLSSQALVAVCCETPAKLYGLWPRKGSLDIGADADLVLLDPPRVISVDPAQLHMGTDYHPLAGKPLRGWPVMTLLRGKVVAENGAPAGPGGRGTYAERQFSLP